MLQGELAEAAGAPGYLQSVGNTILKDAAVSQRASAVCMCQACTCKASHSADQRAMLPETPQQLLCLTDMEYSPARL